MRFAKTVTALALACSLALAIPTFAAPAAEEQAGRQEDLELLYQTIRDRHPGPFTNTPEQEFLARIAQIEARIDTEDSMRSFGLVSVSGSLVGDSHTTTNLTLFSAADICFPCLEVDGDWVLYQVDASHQGALGQQVTSVNGFSMIGTGEVAPLMPSGGQRGSAPTDYQKGTYYFSLPPGQPHLLYPIQPVHGGPGSCPWRPSLLRSWPTWSRGSYSVLLFWICGTTAAA